VGQALDHGLIQSFLVIWSCFHITIVQGFHKESVNIAMAVLVLVSILSDKRKDRGRFPMWDPQTAFGSNGLSQD